MSRKAVRRCSACNEKVSGRHYCDAEDRYIDEGDALLSGIIGYATNSAIIGGIVGGDLLGGIIGDILSDGDLDLF
jgi:hypothetical protein